MFWISAGNCYQCRDIFLIVEQDLHWVKVFSAPPTTPPTSKVSNWEEMQSGQLIPIDHRDTPDHVASGSVCKAEEEEGQCLEW